MKRTTRRKKISEAAPGLRFGETFVELKKATEVIQRVARDSGRGKKLKVQVYNGGLVMRFTDTSIKEKVTKTLAREAVSVSTPPEKNKFRSVYAKAVGQLYAADRIDTQGAIDTARSATSEKEKAFYSRFSPAKR